MTARDRLGVALETRALHLPGDGRIAVFGPTAADDLSALPRDRVQVLTGIRPDFDHFAAQGHDCAVAPEGRYGAAVVFLPRAKARARALVAQAEAASDGPVIVDGAKTHGIESMLRACRARVAVSAPVSLAHGKVFAFAAAAAFVDWRGAARAIEGGFVTAPGVFSADGIDPGSRLLADHLPAAPGAHVVDLGAGWGYLAARVLACAGVGRVDLVEADAAALDCARRNVTDPRAHLHWADATRWQPDRRPDCVVTNPPFHQDRAADPGLGRAFIAAAAAMLAPAGQLWLVANRHLPYEAALAAGFRQVTEVAGDNRFKVLHAARPGRAGR